MHVSNSASSISQMQVLCSEVSRFLILFHISFKIFMTHSHINFYKSFTRLKVIVLMEDEILKKKLIFLASIKCYFQKLQDNKVQVS